MKKHKDARPAFIHHKLLRQKIQAHLPLHGARLAFMAQFVMALIVVRTVTLSTVASALNVKVFPESNEKRVKRFFREVCLDPHDVGRLLLALLPTYDKLVLSLDRTTWYLGGRSVNILMLAVAYQGVALPLVWSRLSGAGNSCTKERLALLDRALALVSADQIETIVADREFCGKAWLRGLQARKLRFVMRVRNNTLIESRARTRSAQRRYGYLRRGECHICPKRCWVFKLRLYLAVTKSETGELVVLVSNGPTERALVRYAQRWQIETLFAALKSRGFNLEDTHMIAPERLDKLLALLAIALIWAYRVGEWVCERRPAKLKKHGYAHKSCLRRGLEVLRSAILAANVVGACFSLRELCELLSP